MMNLLLSALDRSLSGGGAEFFLEMVNRSISASWLVLAVILLRLLLKRAPKRFTILLWATVALRLVCPVSIKSPVSLVPSPQTIPPEILMDWAPQIDTGFPGLNQAVNPVITESFAPQGAASVNPLQILVPLASLLWLAGIVLLLAYTLVSYLRLRRRVATAVRLRYNIFQSEYVTSPFVLGIFRPRIYLPYAMAQEALLYVIAHEKAHIRRRDHWWKPLGFLLLSLYWFNPVMWLAYSLFCKDIELACDEAVIRSMNSSQRADYAQALLACSGTRHWASACPIAFGEVGVKARIRSVMHYKKPTFWILLCSVIACLVLAVCFLTDPKEPEIRSIVQGNLKTYYEMTDGTWMCDDISYQHRLERKGRLPNAAADTVYVYLSNVDISFEQAYQATLSSHTEDHFDAKTAVLVEMRNGDAPPAQTEPSAETPPPTETAPPESQAGVNDLAYFLELGLPDKEFQYMDPEKCSQILSEYGDLLDGYSLIDRETTDGSCSYIVGCYNGNPEDSKLSGINTGSFTQDENNVSVQYLYPDEEWEAAKAALHQREPYENGHYIHKSVINHSPNTGFLLIQPVDSRCNFGDIFNKYLQPNGRAYLLDAASRGIALCDPEGPYLEVYLISDTWGEICEKIPLTEEQASQILSEERQTLEDGWGFLAKLQPGPNSALNLTEDDSWYTEFNGVPQTVLDLAAEKCGYRFASPRDIRSDILEARLDCPWLDSPRYAAEADLPRLQSILSNAEFGYVGACGYGAKLTIRMADGSEMVMFKGTDSCDSMVFGSYGGYFIGDPDNNLAFWDIFGLDPGTKQILETP